MKTLIATVAALALALPGAALADPPHHAPAHGYHKNKHKKRMAQPIYEGTRIWRGNDGKYYCKRNDGTTGLIVGAAAGALAGRAIAGRGDKTLGTIIGAAGGAILGREIDRGDYRCE